MTAAEELKNEIALLLKEQSNLTELASDTKKLIEFGWEYQAWYSRAMKVVESLAPERLNEFVGYYLIDPKRKATYYTNYVIQDYIKAVGARTDHFDKPLWDINNTVQIRILNQAQIIQSLSSRIDSVLQDVTGHLFAELQDKELEAARQLSLVSFRAAGALAGVVLERHLQRAAKNHGITITKKNPTIADMNDPLKEKGVYSVPTWRKVQLLADIRNLCSHQKDEEPTKEQVEELINGVNVVIKSVF